MDPSSLAPVSSLHLAMAAFVGASLMAISAFYIHKRSVDQVLQRLIEIRRTPSGSSGNRPCSEELEQEDDDDSGDYRRGHGFDGGGAIDDDNGERNLSRSMDQNVLSSCGISVSLPDLASSSRTDWVSEQSVGYTVQGHASSVNSLKTVPPGLPLLRMDGRNEENAQLSCSYARIASVGEHKIPRSQSRNTFESAEDSEEEGPQPADDDGIHFYDENVDSSTTNNRMRIFFFV